MWHLFFWLQSAKPTEEKEEEGAAGEEGTEEEPKVMTLDEWKALQAAKRVKPEYNIRKPGEGCSNDPQWKKMVALTRKNPKEQSEDDEEEEVDACISVFVLSPYVYHPHIIYSCNANHYVKPHRVTL